MTTTWNPPTPARSPTLAALLEAREPTAWAVVLEATDRATGDPVTLGWSDRVGLGTDETDDPPALDFAARLASDWERVAALGTSQTFRALPARAGGPAEITLDDADGAVSAQLEALVVGGGRLRIFAGVHPMRGGLRLPWSEWSERAGAPVVDWQSTGDQVTIELDATDDDAGQGPDRPAVDRVWGAWGGAYRFELAGVGTASAPVAGLVPTGLEVAGSGAGYAVGLVVQIHGLPGRAGLLRAGTGGQWVALVDVEESGQLTVDVGAWADRATTAEALPMGETVGLVARVRAPELGGTVPRLDVAARTADGAWSWWIEDHPLPSAPPIAATVPLEVAYGAGEWSLLDAWALTTDGTSGADPLDGEALRARLDRSEPDSEGLAWHYRIEDRIGSSLVDERGGPAITLAGPGAFEESFDGDDPTRFPAGAAGQVVPRALGPIYNAPMVLVSTPADGHRASDRPVSALGPVRGAGGVTLDPADYTVDLARAVVSTGHPSPTSDLVGETADGPTGPDAHRVSAQLAAWTGRAIVNDLVWDPVVGVLSPPGGPLPLDEIVETLLRSACACALRLDDGRLYVAHWPLPEALDPTTAVDLADLDERPDVLAEHAPAWRLRVGWRRNWAPIERGSILESVPAGEALDLTLPYRWLADPRREVLATHADAVRLDVPTYLTTRADAAECLRRWRAVRGVRRRFVSLAATGAAWSVEPGHLVRHAGAFYAAHTVRATPSADRFTLEVFR